MRTTILLVVLFLCTVLFYFWIGQDQTTARRRLIIDHMQASETIFIRFNENLRSELRQAVQEHGAIGSLPICEQVEQQIEKEAQSHDPRIQSVRRVSLKTFNPEHHTPTAAERAWLQKMEICPVCRSQPGPVILEDATSMTVIFPIYMEKKSCLLCHGNVDVLKDDVREALAKQYANHSAIGYQAGDFRGGFAVEWNK